MSFADSTYFVVLNFTMLLSKEDLILLIENSDFLNNLFGKIPDYLILY